MFNFIQGRNSTQILLILQILELAENRDFGPQNEILGKKSGFWTKNLDFSSKKS